MDNQRQKFIPELVDEQLEHLLAKRLPVSLDEHLINDLQRMYQSDDRSLTKVWQRLGLEENQLISMGRQPETPGITQSSASAKLLDLERNRHMHRSRKHSLVRILSLLSAACIAVLIVGSTLVVLNLAHQNQSSHTASLKTTRQHQQQASLPQGIYTNDTSHVFRLDGQTHQLLWQQTLKDVAKIVPSGNVVYILQSSQSSNGTNAVVALDAKSGRSLWTHAFTHKTDVAQTTDLVLAQNQLYVGWEMWTGTNNMDMQGQISVLNATNGSLQAVYSNASVWSLAVGSGVIAVSGNYSLQVYDASSGQSLWHVTYTSGSSEPVRALNIVNGLLYTTISTNNEVAGNGEDYLVVYNISSGKQIWQSPIFPGSSLDASFAIDQHIVYFATFALDGQAQGQPQSGNVYAYDIQSNKQLWRKPINGGGQEPLILSNGVLYTVADNGSDLHAHVIALDTATGTIRWQYTLTSQFLKSLALNNGVVYVSDSGSSGLDHIDAFNAENGHLLWEDAQHGTNHLTPAE
ncbi:MAG TPA: PQQ-binding-like beta-propeller repeat protein [Ktedonobacteraceae bacterium]|nr:PQQ-binding-like beta-propeller repeat protein [Ktedonobacteraceae bacterium]